ncbi:LysM peptidoglycan-binding domain-containing protein [Streptococcus pluranimalium]
MLNKQKVIKSSLLGISTLAVLSLASVVGAETYTVQAGDTLSGIANRYQTSIQVLAEQNHISNLNYLEVGQTLTIDGLTESNTTPVSPISSPQSSLSAADQAAKEEIAQRESSGSYTAQNGQYYGRYQLTISYLNGDLSPENQERVADAYVNDRYGSWSAALAFWNANGWY